jgi:transcriptional regulator with XRE-family HTH domain
MNMKELRQKAGLKAEEVALKLDIATSTVHNWEQGRTKPKLRVDQFALLCRLYQCGIDELNEASKQSELEFSVRQSKNK